MGSVGDSGIESGHRFLVGGLGVSGTDNYTAVRQSLDGIQGIRHLGSQGYQPHSAVRRPSFDIGGFRRANVIFVVGTLLFRIQKRPLEVQPQGIAPLVSGGLALRNHLPRLGGIGNRRGNNGRQKSGYTELGQVGGNFPDRGRISSEILAEAAVELHLDQSRNQVFAAGIDLFGSLRTRYLLIRTDSLDLVPFHKQSTIFNSLNGADYRGVVDINHNSSPLQAL